jgi:hypothetical protein
MSFYSGFAAWIVVFDIARLKLGLLPECLAGSRALTAFRMGQEFNPQILDFKFP